MPTFEPRFCAQAAHSHQPSPAPVSAVCNPITAAWRRLAQFCAEARRNRRDVQVLSQLDDHQLRDIGLTRGQVESFIAERS